jgi:hypothetical protein
MDERELHREVPRRGDVRAEAPVALPALDEGLQDGEDRAMREGSPGEAGG